MGTFCMWYVPVKCFLGRLGTNKWHFVPTTFLVATNRYLFVPDGRLITWKPRKDLLRGGGKDYFVFVSFANVHHVHYLLNWNGFVCVDREGWVVVILQQFLQAGFHLIYPYWGFVAVYME